MIRVNIDIGDFRFRHLGLFGPIPTAGGGDLDPDRDRSSSDANQLGVERNQIADKHRLQKNDLFHGDGNDPVRTPAARLLGAGLIDIGKDDPAENSAGRIGVARHHQDPGLWLVSTVFHLVLPSTRY